MQQNIVEYATRTFLLYIHAQSIKHDKKCVGITISETLVASHGRFFLGGEEGG